MNDATSMISARREPRSDSHLCRKMKKRQFERSKSLGDQLMMLELPASLSTDSLGEQHHDGEHSSDDEFDARVEDAIIRAGAEPPGDVPAFVSRPVEVSTGARCGWTRK
jgi:hypothetical protein